MKSYILTKETPSEIMRGYFEGVLKLSHSDESFPVDFDHVWGLVFKNRNKAVKALSELFFEGDDYEVLLNQKVDQTGRGGHNKKSYKLSVACLEYFIARKVRPVFEVYRNVFHKVASRSNFQIPANLGDALQLAADQAKQIEIDAPKVALAESITASTNSIRIGDYAKAISKQTGFIVGRNRLFAWLKFEKILTSRNMPYQKYIDNCWFEVKESTYEHKGTNGPRAAFTTLVTGKGQASVLDRFKKSDFFQDFLNKSATANQ